MKNYNQLLQEKQLIEQHIGYLKQQYVKALLTDDELFREMEQATKALKKVNKQINS